MASTALTMTTYTCDAADCDVTLALGGPIPWTEATNRGWGLDIPVGSKKFDFCPDCLNQLEEFVGA